MQYKKYINLSIDNFISLFLIVAKTVEQFPSKIKKNSSYNP